MGGASAIAASAVAIALLEFGVAAWLTRECSQNSSSKARGALGEEAGRDLESGRLKEEGKKGRENKMVAVQYWASGEKCGSASPSNTAQWQNLCLLCGKRSRSGLLTMRVTEFCRPGEVPGQCRQGTHAYGGLHDTTMHSTYCVAQNHCNSDYVYPAVQ